MTERVKSEAMGSAEQSYNLSPRAETSRVLRLKVMVRVLGPVLALSAIVAACESDSQSNNPFGFDIPNSIGTTEEALSFVREQEAAKGIGQVLVENEDVEITSFVGGIPELERFPDISVRIIAETKSKDEALQIQSEWEDHLERLFDPIGVCETTETVDYNDAVRDVVVDWTAFVGPQHKETPLGPCPESERRWIY